MLKTSRCLVFCCMLLFFSWANANEAISTLEIAETIASHFLHYNHYRVIGTCLWWKMTPHGPVTYPTLAIDEYLPDLVVTVATHENNNPWSLAKKTLDGPSYTLANQWIKTLTGFPLGNGKTSHSQRRFHDNETQTFTVDVIGSPVAGLNLPNVHLPMEITPFMPYFQSNLDVLGGRLGVAEKLRTETWNPLGSVIGKSQLNHWGMSFPRDMRASVHNGYKAAVIAALHAADIVTNRNALHVVTSTRNRCGKKCSVANVTEKTSNNTVIWQEVYPIKRTIEVGEDDSQTTVSLGQADQAKGKGNYVFVLWRHYRGCIDGTHFISSTMSIPKTEKR